MLSERAAAAAAALPPGMLRFFNNNKGCAPMQGFPGFLGASVGFAHVSQRLTFIWGYMGATAAAAAAPPPGSLHLFSMEGEHFRTLLCDVHMHGVPLFLAGQLCGRAVVVAGYCNDYRRYATSQRPLATSCAVRE